MFDELEIRPLEGLNAETTGASPRLVGYAIRANVLSENLGGFREVIAPEAVQRALEVTSDLVALRKHDTNHCSSTFGS